MLEYKTPVLIDWRRILPIKKLFSFEGFPLLNVEQKNILRLVTRKNKMVVHLYYSTGVPRRTSLQLRSENETAYTSLRSRSLKQSR